MNNKPKQNGDTVEKHEIDLPAKKPRLSNGDKYDDNDEYYFKSYENMDSHYTMLTDSVRTLAYRQSIDAMSEELKDATVIDVGSGTGILSLFCANAGAKKVYALEANSVAELSRQFVKENQKDNVVEVIQTVAEEAKLPVDKVDAIVSEWMGYCLVCENMLSSVLDVRDRFLRRGGLMFPCSARLMVAGANSDDYNDEREADTWRSLSRQYGVDMGGCVLKAMIQSLVDNAVVAVLPPHFLATREDTALELDLYTASKDEVRHLGGRFRLQPLGQVHMSHLVFWFTTDFPDGSQLNTSPCNEPTHWMQTLIKLPRSLSITQECRVSGSVRFSPANCDKRRVSIFIDLEHNKYDGSSDQMHFQSFL